MRKGRLTFGIAPKVTKGLGPKPPKAEKPGDIPKIRKLATLKQYEFLNGIPPGFSPAERFFRQRPEGYEADEITIQLTKGAHMITCAYCGNECPEDAQICPKCGKPIIRLAVDDEPDYNKMAMELLQKNEQKEPLSQKTVIITACVVLILALVAYATFVR